MVNAKIVFFAMLFAIVSVSNIYSALTRKRETLGDRFILTYYDGKTKVAIEIRDQYDQFVKMEGKVPDGIVKEYQGGRVLMEVPFKNGKKEGIEKYYRESGELMEENNYKDSKLDGLSKNYYPGGTLNSEENYSSGRLDGVSKSYYNNGKPWTIVNYKAGILEGNFKEYFENGNLQHECTFKGNELENTFDNAKKDSIEKIYRENGELIKESNYKDGRLEGFTRNYYPGVKLYSEEFYVNDRQEGIGKIYYKNGKIWKLNNYQSGSMEGDSKEYYDNGTLKTECIYKDHRLEGKLKSYQPDGKLWREWPYKEGVREGICREYYPQSGKLYWECIYKNGEPDGEYKTYAESGELIGEDTYVKGAKINSRIYAISAKPISDKNSLPESTAGLALSLYNTLTAAAVSSKKIDVIDVVKVDKILKDKKMEVPRGADQALAVKYGKLLGAKFIVIGHVGKIANNGSSEIQFYLTNVETVNIEANVIKSAKPGKGAAAIVKIEKDWIDIIDTLELRGALKKRGSLAIIISDFDVLPVQPQ